MSVTVPPPPLPPRAADAAVTGYLNALFQWAQALAQTIDQAGRPAPVLLADLPPAALPVRLAVVLDHPEGATLAWNDGAQWLRIPDNAPIAPTTTTEP